LEAAGGRVGGDGDGGGGGGGDGGGGGGVVVVVVVVVVFLPLFDVHADITKSSHNMLVLTVTMLCSGRSHP